jgi:hypothetical protein
MGKLLTITVITMVASLEVTQAAIVSSVNPSLTPQPPQTLTPVTPALSPAFKVPPFPFASHPARTVVPPASKGNLSAPGSRLGASPQPAP